MNPLFTHVSIFLASVFCLDGCLKVTPPDSKSLEEAISYHLSNPEAIAGYSAQEDTSKSIVFIDVFLKHFQESDSLFILSARFPALKYSSPFTLLGFRQKGDTVLTFIGVEGEEWPEITELFRIDALEKNVSNYQRIPYKVPNEHIYGLLVTVGQISDGQLVDVRNENRGLRFY